MRNACLRLAITLVFLAMPGFALALQLDLYRTQDLPKYITQARQKYDLLNREQAARQKELATVNAEINTLQARAGGTKKNKQAAADLQDALQHQKVMQQKITFYAPKIKEQAQVVQALQQAQKARQAELASLPKGVPEVWSVEQAKTGTRLYQTLYQRAKTQQTYYEKSFNTSAVNSVTEAANRQNFLAEVQSDVRNYQRALARAETVLDRKVYEDRVQRQNARSRVEDQQAEARREAARTPAPTAAPTAVPTPRPSPTPTPTPEPTPEPTLGERVDAFMIDFWWVALVVVFLSVTLSTFLTMRILDNRNHKHTVAAAVLIGAGVAGLFLIPVFGMIFGLLGLLVVFPIYYQLSMDTLAKALPMVIALMLATGGILVTLLTLIFR